MYTVRTEPGCNFYNEKAKIETFHLHEATLLWLSLKTDSTTIRNPPCTVTMVHGVQLDQSIDVLAIFSA